MPRGHNREKHPANVIGAAMRGPMRVLSQKAPGVPELSRWLVDPRLRIRAIEASRAPADQPR
jgi:hypothetical protein